MKNKFSPSTGGIYPKNVYSEFPEDAIEIPDVLYARYLAGEFSAFQVVGGNVVEKALAPPDANANRIREIDLRLAQIDEESIRPLRAFASGTQMDFDVNKLQSLEQEAADLRAERATL